MKKNITVSVGIPAYNESLNIKFLIDSLLIQEQKGFILKEIIVASDGSTDGMDEIVESYAKRNVKLLKGAKRKGKSFRLNQIFKNFSADLLILCDADILIKDKLLFSKVVQFADLKNVKFATVNMLPTKSVNLFQQITSLGSMISRQIAITWRYADNYLVFRGCFLIFDRKFAKKIKLSEKLVNNDAYIYFFAKKQGITPQLIKKANVYYKTPTNFIDHLRQSIRFQISRDEMKKYFDLDEKYEYKIPLKTYLYAIIMYFIINPFLMLSYILVSFKTRFSRKIKITQTWTIAGSTKDTII